MSEDRKKIAYVEHPCTKAEKAAYNQKGFKVRDIRFAPETLEGGDKKFAKPKPKAEEPKAGE